MVIRYNRENLLIEIWIAKEDIDRTDVVLLYETTKEPSGGGTLIATLRSRETDDDPSFGDSYYFTHTKIINEPDTYNFRFTTRDLVRNESDTVGTLEHTVCNVPFAPKPIPFDELNFGTNTSGSISLTPDIVGQWKMNDSSGTTIIDSSSNSYNGTHTNNINSVTGKINTAIDYNGTTDYTTLPNFSDINTSDFSICFWIKTTGGDGTIIHKYHDTGTIEEGFRIYYETSFLKIDFNIFGAGGLIVLTGNSIPPTGDWTFVVATFDRDGDMSFFKNSFFDNSISIAIHDGTSINQSGIPLLFGRQDNGNDPIGDYFDGTLDNVCIFDRLLTQTEITWLYKNGNGTEELDADLSTVFQTVFHTPINNPSAIEEDGDYDIDSTNLGVIDLRPEENLYFRTYSNVCGSESDDSTTTSNLNLPTSDVTADSLFIQAEANGTFLLRWGYNKLSNDPITHFNIYYRIVINPSLEVDDNPSVEDWILDGTVTWNAIINNFSFISTTSFAEGTIVEWKVNPVSISGERDDSGDTIEGTADTTAPIVNNFFTRTTIL